MPEPVDLRSDTVTRPTLAMRRAMAEAEVGDDVFLDDPTVLRLEARFAERVGKEAALFTPSGTMANQIAVRLHTGHRHGAGVLVAGAGSHVVAYEPGFNDAEFVLLDDGRGALDPADVAGVLADRTEVAAVFAEHSHMSSGGRCWPVTALDAIAALGRPVHLDGARLFNASVALGVEPDRLAAEATTVMACLSKGLGAPVGSVLAGPRELIAEARQVRRRLGGGMRQVGVLAAAGLVALDQHVDRLADDHARARRLAVAVADRWPEHGFDADSVTTNIVIFGHPAAGAVIDHLATRGVRALTLDATTVRMITHLDVDDDGIDRVIAALATAP